MQAGSGNASRVLLGNGVHMPLFGAFFVFAITHTLRADVVKQLLPDIGRCMTFDPASTEEDSDYA